MFRTKAILILLATAFLTWAIAVIPSNSQYMLMTGAGTAPSGAVGPCVPGTNATNFLNRTIGLDATHTAAYCVLINGLDTDSLFTSLDVLFIFATQDSTTANLNLINGTYFITLVNSPTFTMDRGYTGNGVNANAAINYNPATAGGAFVQNSAHASVWNLTNASDAAPAMSEANGVSPAIYPKFSDNKLYTRITDDTSAGYAITDPRGLLVGSRTAFNLTTAYLNAVSQGTASDASAAINNGTINTLGTGNLTFSSYQLAEVSLGGGLNGTQATNFYNRLRTYMTTVGVP